MGTLTDTPAPIAGPLTIPWSANSIYQFDGADPVEGAADGASFGGLGVDNQPHQQLANRTAALYNALQAFAALITLRINVTPQNGKLEIPLGSSPPLNVPTLIVQWGQALFPMTAGAQVDFNFVYRWPYANYVMASWATPMIPLGGAGDFTVGFIQGGISLTRATVRCRSIAAAAGANYGFTYVLIGV